MTEEKSGKWHFWIDRGGTFTDVVARASTGEILTRKFLSENPEHYDDAALHGIRDILGIACNEETPARDIAQVKMGTTIATNALLERTGDRVVLAITRGFGDALKIGYQNRPQLFARHIVLPDLLYEQVIEIDERMDAQGNVLSPLDESAAREALARAYADGIRAVAIVLMHGYRFPDHECRLAEMAQETGFSQISASHTVSPLMKLVARGDTTVVDAYLSPLLRRYVDRVSAHLQEATLLFMTSGGGLTNAQLFQGKDAILSGPAGGVIGMIRTAEHAGFDKVIGFDMGGTSTDVSHYDDELERTFENIVAGVRVQAPMVRIHTIAAGGGSILHFDGARFRVGPQSAGANPGPACYRRGGLLTVTDANVMLGRIQPSYFPKVFGPSGAEPLDRGIVVDRFAAMADAVKDATGMARTPEEVADGFLRIAVENMANAIKKISVQRGHDITRYVLNCFGGAGGQHACRVADALAITRVLIHPLAGVLSAYGMGLAEIRAMREEAIEARLSASEVPALNRRFEALAATARAEVAQQGVTAAKIALEYRVHLRYEGTDTALVIPWIEDGEMTTAFAQRYRQLFGFDASERALIIEAIEVEAIGEIETAANLLPASPSVQTSPAAVTTVKAWFEGQWLKVPLFDRDNLSSGAVIPGPAIIVDANATTVVEPEWQAEITIRADLVLSRQQPLKRTMAIGTQVDPVMLEIFNNLFMSIAEQMGTVLANTAHSVNIKERLDFSCAIFDREGNLVANAPHLPVHLGSMGESVQTIIRERRGTMADGDVYVLNNPYNGGTHLPDITVMMPVFDDARRDVLFFVANRGHHADIGGITPGSMPPDSHSIDEEGILLDDVILVSRENLLEKEIRALLASGLYPARNLDQNIADLRAQIAANAMGARELKKMIANFGLDVVDAYMGHVQDNAEEHVRRVIDVLKDGAFTYEMDNGAVINVSIRIDSAKRAATIDFSGSSPQVSTNFNAPPAVTKAAVLYVFRTLVEDDIPLNAGCLKPLEIIIPEGSFLAPQYPAAVVAGNVETSQAITDALYGALGVLAAAQGTMNNLTFGNQRYQYYETICGGSGAGPDFSGTDAVHTHMTNTRLTDPEVLEWRFPVLLRRFGIRPESGGDGRHGGGNGVVRHIEFREAMTAAILSGHRRVPPFGLAGGLPGKTGHNAVLRANGRMEDLGSCGQTSVQPGDALIIETPGGGGFGAP